MEISTVSRLSQGNEKKLCQTLSHEAVSLQNLHTYPLLPRSLAASAQLRGRGKQREEKGCGIYRALVYLALQIRFKVQGAYSE